MFNFKSLLSVRGAVPPRPSARVSIFPSAPLPQIYASESNNESKQHTMTVPFQIWKVINDSPHYPQQQKPFVLSSLNENFTVEKYHKEKFKMFNFNELPAICQFSPVKLLCYTVPSVNHSLPNN